MANIINGTDTGSGGLITTGDSSDELQLQTAETARVTLTNTAVVVNEGGDDVDFRVEGDTDANMLFVDAGNDRVGVGTGTPETKLHNNGTTLLGTGTWPTGSVGNSGSRAAILSSTENALLIVANTESTVGADKGGEILIGGKATTGSENLAASRVAGFKENATSGNFASYLKFSVSNAGGSVVEAARFNSSGNLAFPNGQGIDFSASAGGGATSSVLDDYEEGTWTPTDGSGAGLTFTSVNATYTKIGNQVIARFVLVYPSTASGATSVIAGLPFTVANNQAARQGVVTWADESTLAYFIPNNNSTNFEPRDFSGNNIANSVLSGNQMFGTIIYPV